MRQGKTTVTTSISFEQDVWDRLVFEAETDGRSLANVVNHILREKWKLRKRKPHEQRTPRAGKLP